MPPLPPIVWLAIAGFALLLVALCVLTTTIAVRMARRRWAHWPSRRVVGLLVAATLPWWVVWLAPLRIVASINGTLQLIGWVLVALLVFALLVLFPLTAIVTSVVWWRARRRRAVAVTPPT